MQTADSLEKSLVLGKTEGRRRSGHQRMRWLDGITDVMNMNLGKLQEMLRDRKAWCAAVQGISKSWLFTSDWSFSISPSNKYSGLISLKVYWFDLFAAQGTLRSLLQHHSLKASILWRSAFFMVQLSQSYVTPGKTIALTIRTFVGRVMSLLFNILSRFVIAFLPRSSRLLISWLQSLSAVILEPKKRKSVTTSTFSLLSAMQQWGWMPLS